MRIFEPYKNSHDKIWLLFAGPVTVRYIKFNPMLSGSQGSDAFFRSGGIIWPNLQCLACPMNTFKNYTGNRSVLYDRNVLSECQACVYLSSTTATGSLLYSCSPGAYTYTNRSDVSVCSGCGLGMYLSNGSCLECLDNTFASESNAQMCTECNDASFVTIIPALFVCVKTGLHPSGKNSRYFHTLGYEIGNFQKSVFFHNQKVLFHTLKNNFIP